MLLVAVTPGGARVRLGSTLFTSPKSTILANSCSFFRGEQDVRRLHVAVNETQIVSLGERSADLRQHVQHPLGR